MNSRRFPNHQKDLLRKVEVPYRIAVMTEIKDTKACLEIARGDNTYIFLFPAYKKQEVLSRLARMVESQLPEYRDFEEFDFNIVKRDLDKCIPNY